MSRYACLALIVAVGLAGCTKESEDGGSVPPPSAPPSQPVVSAAPADAPPPAVAPPPVAPPPAPGAPVAAPLPGGGKDEYNGEVIMRDDDGRRLEGEALLRRAMMQHVEGKGLPYPERIEELVEHGTLKSLPPAPNGQKWAIDPATRKIVLK